MPSAQPPRALFTPVRLGAIGTLQHRIALAPLTRCRAHKDNVPSELPIEYYTQRASTPGTLLVSEATLIHPSQGDFGNVPGIWNDSQVDAWRKVTDAVHAKGCVMVCQLWAMGRTAFRALLPQEYDIVSSGDIQIEDDPTNMFQKPRAMTLQEIEDCIGYYAHAARNAIRAGFDGVEIHGANGYLVDQFLQNTCNNRTDEYGGSVENRLRFALRVTKAVCDAVGADRTSIRISPYEPYQGMGMSRADMMETFTALVKQLAPLGLAYLHISEPRVAGVVFLPDDDVFSLRDSLDWMTEIWKPQPLLLTGGYVAESALARAEEARRRGEQVVIAFGRRFISNPDLPERVKRGIPFTPYDRSTFYTPGPQSAHGYIDYTFATQPESKQKTTTPVTSESAAISVQN